ncbi:hypothetical protein PV08_11241 [Exophiala spinifera]|uniref:Uncharacterized protein n=1 Tax=Exophiala spinifera TaxID=91928 RepID=A0A0D2BFY0_9EURO|nr:uncharacterized protein PV08_11241 [Exophiala spinifera]KIW10279.1 hypothetical protein PV08_11241 [Exophiala spinifera]
MRGVKTADFENVVTLVKESLEKALEEAKELRRQRQDIPEETMKMKAIRHLTKSINLEKNKMLDAIQIVAEKYEVFLALTEDPQLQQKDYFICVRFLDQPGAVALSGYSYETLLLSKKGVPSRRKEHTLGYRGAGT